MKHNIFVVIDLPKEIGKTKVEYLELLLENPDGITPSDVTEIYFDDVTIHAANNALRRLKKQGCTCLLYTSPSPRDRS